jgi:acyl-CoA synthetase (NDP forming)
MTLPYDPALDALFDPKSIAVIGASSSPAKIGGLPISFLKQSGFEGSIYPINPKSEQIQGLDAYGSIRDVDAPVDLAICAVPGPLAERAIQDCADTGVRSVVMFSAGFAEVDAKGAAKQDRLTNIARDAGLRLMGPNCMGMANLRSGAIASFHPAFARPVPRTGRIGVVSQSGAFGGLIALMAQRRGIPLAQIITTGNEADVTVSDGLRYLAAQSGIDVILLYVEGVRDGADFLSGLAAAHAAGIPVVVVKLGRTEIGEAAVTSHTAALAGSDAVFDAVLQQFGAYRAHSIEEFFDLGCAAAVAGLPRNPRTGIVTVSGGVGVLMADHAAMNGLELPELSAQTQSMIRDLVPFAGTRNPLDVTGQVINDMSLLTKSLEAMAQDAAGFGSVHLFLGAALLHPQGAKQILPPLLEASKARPDVQFNVAGLLNDEIQSQLDTAGIGSFTEPTHATRATSALWTIAKAHSQPLDRPEPGEALQLPDAPLNEVDSLSILAQAGVPTIETHIATTADEAAKIASQVAGPLVVKILSPDILHKTDLGAVHLNVVGPDAARAAFEACVRAASDGAPQARIQGCVVTPMAPDGVDAILGVTRDAALGPIVMLGVGGIYAELVEDVSFRAAPIGPDEAERMIDDTRLGKLLAGVRGGPALDRPALAQTVSALSRFAAAHADQIESLDVNPVRVLPLGQGALALDAVVLRPNKTGD